MTVGNYIKNLVPHKKKALSTAPTQRYGWPFVPLWTREVIPFRANSGNSSTQHRRQCPPIHWKRGS